MKKKSIILASDHAGFELKENIKKFLIKRKKKFFDLGTYSNKSVDYPDLAHRLSKKMKNGNKFFWHISLWFRHRHGYDSK